MNHQAILTAAELLPRDHARGIARQLEILDELIAELETMEPSAAGAADALYHCHLIAEAQFHEASGHPGSGRPDRWYVSVVGMLNGLARKHGIRESPLNWTIDQ